MLPEETIWDTIVSDHEHVWDNVNAIGREAMASFLVDGESVLDVGCGNGFVYRQALKDGLTFSRYVGVDLSTKFLEAANKLSPEGDWQRMDAEDLQFSDNEFDTVIMMHVLETVNGFERAVMEALRVAKQRVVVCFWKQFAEKTEIKETQPYGFEANYSKEDWFEFLKKIGMPTEPWLEVHAEAGRSNLFFMLEKKHLQVVIAKDAPPEVEKAIDEGTAPPTRRNVEVENMTWNPPVDNFEGPKMERPGHAVAPGDTEYTLKGLFSDTWRGDKLSTAIVDSDDLCDEHDPFDLLMKVKEQFPKFKITMFAIPKKCSPGLLDKYSSLGWVELGVHGYSHEPNTEFAELSYEDVDMRVMAAQSKLLYDGEFLRLFKAPGWQISTEGLQWLKDNDWTVMDQAYNDDRRPEGLKVVRYDDNPENKAQYNIIHTHTWNTSGNDIHEVLKNPPFDQETEFKFISEVAQPWSKSSA